MEIVSMFIMFALGWVFAVWFRVCEVLSYFNMGIAKLVDAHFERLEQKSKDNYAQRYDLANRKKSPGRPPTPLYIEEAIVAIRKDNPYYGAQRIANILSHGHLQYKISAKTVARILKKHGFPPLTPGEEKFNWVLYTRWWPRLYNQYIVGLDFKKIKDLKGNEVFILNFIDHGRRVLVHSIATLHPTAEWINQQVRNALMNIDLDHQPVGMVLDRDGLFTHLVQSTLPSLGIQPHLIDVRSPWQNAVVERFNLTLIDELLKSGTPRNVKHLNALLIKYRDFYNHVRPHMKNMGPEPIPPNLTDNLAVNDPHFFKKPRRLKRMAYVNGLHYGYKWAV